MQNISKIGVIYNDSASLHVARIRGKMSHVLMLLHEAGIDAFAYGGQ
jgi:hypothetical protein